MSIFGILFSAGTNNKMLQKGVNNMQKDCTEAVSTVLRRLKDQGYSQTTVNSHSACYNMLQKYLEFNGLPFSVQAAVEWNEGRKNELSYETYSRYRQAIFRLEYFLHTGSVDCPFCKSSDEFLFRLPVAYNNILAEIKCGGMFSASQKKTYLPRA